jgi:hypothetical protein
VRRGRRPCATTTLADTPIGTINYTVTATDRFGRTAAFSPFINVVSQLAIVDQ